MQTLAFMFKFRFSPRLYLSSLSEDDRTAVVPSALLSATDSTLQKRHHFFYSYDKRFCACFFLLVNTEVLNASSLHNLKWCWASVTDGCVVAWGTSLNLQHGAVLWLTLLQWVICSYLTRRMLAKNYSPLSVQYLTPNSSFLTAKRR